jgi:hypothetical protein
MRSKIDEAQRDRLCVMHALPDWTMPSIARLLRSSPSMCVCNISFTGKALRNTGGHASLTLINQKRSYSRVAMIDFMDFLGHHGCQWAQVVRGSNRALGRHGSQVVVLPLEIQRFLVPEVKSTMFCVALVPHCH